jgi:hypothetical protein
MGKRKLRPSITVYRSNKEKKKVRIRENKQEEEAGGGVRRWTYQMGHLSSLPILSRLPRSAIRMPSVPPRSGSLRSTSLLSFRVAAMTNSDFVVGRRAGCFRGRCLTWRELSLRTFSFVQNFVSEAGGTAFKPG